MVETERVELGGPGLAVEQSAPIRSARARTRPAGRARPSFPEQAAVPLKPRAKGLLRHSVGVTP